MKNLLLCIGTRPDIIKMYPIINELKNNKDINYKIAYARQHIVLAEEILNLFDIRCDYISDTLSKEELNLPSMLSYFIRFYNDCISLYKTDAIIVHGDVIHSLAAALCGFLNRIPIFHIEAGLRTNTFDYPFPEESTRRLISKIASVHFAPTNFSYRNLLYENVPNERIKVTGNTVVDSLNLILNYNWDLSKCEYLNKFNLCEDNKNVVLITLHRREMWDNGLFKEYINLLDSYAQFHNNYIFIFPVHTNPKIVEQILNLNVKYINIIHPPLVYKDFLNLLYRYTYLTITDSGGVLEESSTLGIPVMIMRSDIERPECKIVDEDYACLIDNNIDFFKNKINYYLTNNKFKERKPNVYFGEGNSSKKIIKHILNYLK